MTDELESAVALDDLLRDRFRALLVLPDDDPMVDSYPLSSAACRWLAEALDLNLGDRMADAFLDWDDPRQHS